MKFRTKIDRSAMESGGCLEISRSLGVSPFLAALLQDRGYKDAESAGAFLNADESQLYSPFLLRDMDAAADRIVSALQKKEKILVYGDYDADGITAASVLLLYFESRGAQVLAHIPDRFAEGYGMNSEVLADYIDKGVSLIVTVDTGVKAHDEIAFAVSKGADVVVTDHHECGETLPVCSAVVDPMRADCPYPFKGLAGVGVAFKLICAVEMRLRGEEDVSALLDGFSDLVAIGTIADVMPLRFENRIFVIHGLKKIARRERTGIRALLNVMNNGKIRPVTVSTVSFHIAPRINAAGRISNGSAALKLFLTKDETEASKISQELCACNEERQRIEASILEEAFALIGRTSADDRAVVLAKEGWHKGVIGIAASKICEKTGKPTFLLSIEGDCAKGSGRSAPGVDLVALLEGCSDLLVQFGGHDQAAGLTVRTDKIRELQERMNAFLEHTKSPEEGVITADLELFPKEATLDLARELALLEPCGCGNEAPLFLLRNMEVCAVYPLSEGKHTKVLLSGDGVRFPALLFGNRPECFPASAGEKIDAVLSLSVNEYMNRTDLQAVVRNIALSCEARGQRERSAKMFSALDGGYAPDKEDVPSSEDFKALYLFLKRASEAGRNCLSLGQLFTALPGFTMFKWLVCADVFSEFGLFSYDWIDGEEGVFRFLLPEPKQKFDISNSAVMRKIRKNRGE